MQEQDINRIEHLTSVLLSKGLTNEEYSELKDLLKSPVNKEYFKQLYSIGLISNESKTEQDIELAYQRIIESIHNKEDKPTTKKSKISTLWRNAAAAAILFIAVTGAYQWGIKKSESLAESNTTNIQVPLGSQSILELPDGSFVTLNSGSSIEYSNTFGMSDRNLKLHGEAFFDVKKDKKPFIVSAKRIRLTVLGTQFNLKAYDDEDIVEATLVEGSVKINPDINNDSKEIYLEPNETVVIKDSDKDGSQLSLQKEVDTDLYTSWKDSRWIIQGETLGSIVRKLERRHNVKIEIVDNALVSYKFSGILMDETIQQTLDIIKDTAPIDYLWDKKTIRIYVDPKRKNAFEKSMNKS